MTVEAPAQDAPRGRSAGSGDVARASRSSLRSVAATQPRADVDPPTPEALERHPMTLHAVTLTVSEGRCSVGVEVRWGGDRALAVTEGLCAGGGIDRLVAEATVRAVASIDPTAERVAVEAVVVGPVGPRLVATASLAQPVGAGEEPFAGATTVGPSGSADAVARAVLDALSRRSTSS